MRITPFGWPGAVFFLVVTRTVSSEESESAVHDCIPEAYTPVQNVVIILCDSLIMFFLASGDEITETPEYTDERTATQFSVGLFCGD